MTDQKGNQAQPTEISDDDLDGAQGGTIGNALSVQAYAIPGAQNVFMGTGMTSGEFGDAQTEDANQPQFTIANVAAGGGGSSL